MNCNFFTNHKGLINRVNVCNILIAFALYLLGSAVLAVSIGIFTLGTEIDFDFITITFVFLSTFPIFLLVLAYKRYKRVKKIDNAEFTYKMFKDWYSLNPKRFIFDIDKLGFHYMVNGNPDYVDENKEVYRSYHGFSWERDILNSYKHLMPKTFLDYLRYNLFVERLYLEKTYYLKKKEQIMQEKCRNEELLNVLNVVQSDIDKVMRESQDILNQEADKLEKVRNEQLS